MQAMVKVNSFVISSLNELIGNCQKGLTIRGLDKGYH
jgi:hypothetical protein